jgi:hypothetical protein
VYPSDKNDVHHFCLMCGDIKAFSSEMGRHRIARGPVHDEGWGLVTQVMLPGGGKLAVYEPRHARQSDERESAGYETRKPPCRQARQGLPKRQERTKAR